jgi:hypothetical protein
MGWSRPSRLVSGLSLLVFFCSCTEEKQPPLYDAYPGDGLPDMSQPDHARADTAPPDLPAADSPAPDLAAPDTVPASRLSDHSVNNATASISGGVISLVTKKQTNSPGSFNGQGTGNKAILGVWGYDRLKLGSLPQIKTVSSVVSGTHHFYFNFLVDLACDGSEPKVFVHDGLSAGTNTFDISKDSFLVVMGLDGKNNPPWATNKITLSTVTTAYPKACLVDSVSKDGGMPKGTKLRAVLLVLGDSSHNLDSSNQVTSLTIGGTTIK